MTAIKAVRHHTAILFFSHRPECEWRNKQFVRQDYAKSRQVASAFYQHTLRAAKDSGFPILEVNDTRQRGDQFGTRLANAFADAFAQGYKHVIAVGSDCPRLHEVDWSAVAEHLVQGAPVLGPTPDHGGVYLIGISRAQFNRQGFAALPWQSPHLFSALAQYLSKGAGVTPVLLAERDDVNGHRDLMDVVRAYRVLPYDLIAQLRSVLGPVGHTMRSEESVAAVHICNCRLRAPPALRQGNRA